jgi:hypothetical protein
MKSPSSANTIVEEDKGKLVKGTFMLDPQVRERKSIALCGKSVVQANTLSPALFIFNFVVSLRRRWGYTLGVIEWCWSSQC